MHLRQQYLLVIMSVDLIGHLSKSLFCFQTYKTLKGSYYALLQSLDFVFGEYEYLFQA